jgi:hypothetical protein
MNPVLMRMGLPETGKAALDHNSSHLSSGIAVYSNWILHRTTCIVKKSRTP